MVPLALIGHLILIPLLSGVGAAVVTASAACLGAIASLFTVYRTWGILPPVKTLLKSTFCSMLALVIAIMWPVSGLMLILKLIAIICIILLTFLLLGEFTASEIALIGSMLKWRLGLGQSKGEV